jgi:hypothetical protein
MYPASKANHPTPQTPHAIPENGKQTHLESASLFDDNIVVIRVELLTGSDGFGKRR